MPRASRLLAVLAAATIFTAPAAHAQESRSQFLPLASRWSAALSAPPLSRPVLAGELVVAALQSGVIVARNAADGTDAWNTELLAAHPMAADDERVYVASRDAVHALQLASGRELWRREFGTLTAPPIVRNGWLVVPAAGTLTALRASDGSVVWSKPLGAMDASPAIDGDVLFVPLADGRLMSRALATGEPRWERRLGGAPAEPLAVGGKVYVGAADKVFYALDADDGDVEWPFRIGAAPRGRAVADEGKVYYIALDNVLRAFDRGDGALEWRKGLTYRPASGPVLIGSAILVPGSSAALPVFGEDGAALTTVKFPATLVWVSNATTGASGYPVVGVVTGDLQNPWTLWLFEGSADPPPIPLVELTAAPGVTIAIVMPE